jgi:hypothetical protein
VPVKFSKPENHDFQKLEKLNLNIKKSLMICVRSGAVSTPLLPEVCHLKLFIASEPLSD